jgi:hypothetical protein
MVVYCTDSFIEEYQKLIKKKQYKDLENIFLNFFLNHPFEIIATGNRLYGPEHIPYQKKRIPDAGGYRLYFLADNNAQNIYLNFIHAKRQPLGYENIGPEKKKELHDAVLVARNNTQGLYKLTKCLLTGIAIFTP